MCIYIRGVTVHKYDDSVCTAVLMSRFGMIMIVVDLCDFLNKRTKGLTMQINFYSLLWSYLPRVPIILTMTVHIYIYIYIYYIYVCVCVCIYVYIYYIINTCPLLICGHSLYTAYITPGRFVVVFEQSRIFFLEIVPVLIYYSHTSPLYKNMFTGRDIKRNYKGQEMSA